MPEWLVERGIGETRAVLIENGEIVEARIEVEGVVPAGTLLRARLVNTGSSRRNAVACADGGEDYLLPQAPSGVTEGAALTIEVVRQRIPGIEPWKRPLARACDAEPSAPLPLENRIGGRLLPFPPAGRDALSDAGWADLIEQAATGSVDFSGGALNIHLTPAMTLIDVDGTLAPEQLAVAGAAAAARAIRRLDIGGSIGIDLPTVGSKAARQAAAAAIDANLSQPFERTAVNGFGFVQIVRPRRRASLLEIWTDRPGAEARRLLRRVALEGAGARRLVAHPAVIAVFDAHSGWCETLARQIGGEVRLHADPKLPISAGHGESI